MDRLGTDANCSRTLPQTGLSVTNYRCARRLGCGLDTGLASALGGPPMSSLVTKWSTHDEWCIALKNRKKVWGTIGYSPAKKERKEEGGGEVDDVLSYKQTPVHNYRYNVWKEGYTTERTIAVMVIQCTTSR